MALSDIKHKIAHKFHWNFGRVKTWHEDNRLMSGFKCDKCGKMSSIHIEAEYSKERLKIKFNKYHFIANS